MGSYRPMGYDYGEWVVSFFGGVVGERICSGFGCLFDLRRISLFRDRSGTDVDANRISSRTWSSSLFSLQRDCNPRMHERGSIDFPLSWKDVPCRSCTMMSMSFVLSNVVRVVECRSCCRMSFVLSNVVRVTINANRALNRRFHRPSHRLS